MNNFGQFSSWSQSTSETARHPTLPTQRRKFAFFSHSDKAEEKLLRQHTLPEMYKEKSSSETFSIDEEEDDFDDDDNLQRSWCQESNENIKSNKEKLQNASISYCLAKQMLLIGPPNTPDIEIKFQVC